MNLKTMMYTTGAAMALFGTTAVTTITANAAVTPTQQTQQAKSKDVNKANDGQASKKQAAQTSTATKANDADKSKTTTTPAKTSNTPNKTQTTTNTNANQNGKSAKTSGNNNADKAITPDTHSASAATTNSNKTASTKFDQKAPRLTGSTYKAENAGFKTSIKNTHANKDVTVKYSINTYESDGSASSKPFQIKIYKDGNLYKTINASSGTATGSFRAPKGSYTLRVMTSQSTHYTGGLSVQ